MMEGRGSSSRSRTNSVVFAFSHFFAFSFLAAGCSVSLKLDVSYILALLPIFLNVSICSLDAHAISLLENTFTRFAFSGIIAIVCSVSCTTFQVFLARLFPVLNPWFSQGPVLPRQSRLGSLRVGIPRVILALKNPKIFPLSWILPCLAPFP